MAAKLVKKERNLAIKYVAGVDDKGKDIIRYQRMPKLKISADFQDVLDVVNLIKDFLENPISEILIEDKNTLVNE
ncbi:DUF1659 domain-containing protein [Clostridium niameyense]|uniref:DUF1659 domain-containing protein n=1 Tax=Clostridium niameyense TaxID=1622073 RepID=UPI00067E99CF|nr:DUF1659 domain-containing protein [Clostridium niameyense]